MLQRILHAPLDFGATFLFFVLGIAGAIVAAGFPGQAGGWPLVVLLLLALLAGLQLWIFLFARSRDAGVEDAETLAVHSAAGEHTRYWVLRVGASTALIIGFILAAHWIGLFTSAAIYLLTHMLYLGVRPVWLAAVCTAGITAMLYGFFGYLLGVSIPGTLSI